MRNVKVLGNYLMKARQKTKPKYAARYLVRVLFPKEALLCSVIGVSTQGWCSLDPNKMNAIRGMIPFKMHRSMFYLVFIRVFNVECVLFSRIIVVQQLLSYWMLLWTCCTLLCLLVFENPVLWFSMLIFFFSIRIKQFCFSLVSFTSCSSAMPSVSKFPVTTSLRVWHWFCGWVWLVGWFVYGHGVLGTKVTSWFLFIPFLPLISLFLFVWEVVKVQGPLICF